MVAGDPVAYRRYAELLTKISGKIFHLGDQVGTASKVKLVNNLLAGVNLVASAEAMALAIRLGLDPQMIFDVVNQSSGASWMFKDRMARVIAGDYAPRAALPILTKDLGLCLAMASENEFPMPVGEVARRIFTESSAATFGAEDDAAIIKYYQTLSNIKLPDA
jgi:L-threonate 2-dehydrogenase